jgi:CRISPR-associated protein Csb1
MSDERITVAQFDEWLKDDSDVAALVMRQWLEPVEGKDAVIFPPTYARPERMREEDWLGYNIDPLNDGSGVCQIDSVGSQANRMEPIFKREYHKGLVPQVTIQAGERQVHLLDAGHRAADAIVRFSTLGPELDNAFRAYQVDGNAEPLARIAPTSIVFGSWDSRATQAKLPRIVRSVIRAFAVTVLHRSAMYVPAIGYVDEGLLDAPANKTEQDSMSQLGLRHAPATRKHGGIQVLGEIRRDASVNLAALRSLAAGKDGNDATLALRRYVFGLSLVSFTAPQEMSLREGCQLVPNADRPAEWHLVRHHGKREPFSLSHGGALSYAQAAAEAFGVGPNKEARFEAKRAKEALGQSKEERRRPRRTQDQQSEQEPEA